MPNAARPSHSSLPSVAGGLAAALVAVLASVAPAAADLPPPDGEKFVGFRFQVTGIPAGSGRVLIAYPCGTSNGAPIAEYRRLEEGQVVEVGRRGGECAIYSIAQEAFDAFIASEQPGQERGFQDPALDALTAAGVACSGGPQPRFVLPTSDRRDAIEQTLVVSTLDATSCALTEAAATGATGAAPAPPQTGCRGCAAPGDPTGPLLMVALVGGATVIGRRRRRRL